MDESHVGADGLTDIASATEDLMTRAFGELKHAESPARTALLTFVRYLAAALCALENGGKASTQPDVALPGAPLALVVPEPSGAPAEVRHPRSPSPRDYLEEKGISVTRETKQTIVDDNTVAIATYMGDNYPHLSRFIDACKRSASTGQSLKHSLVNNPADIAYVTQLCRKLNECAFLKEYAYQRTQRFVWAQAMSDGAVQNFFNGAWFEIYVRKVVEEILAKQQGVVDEAQILKGACIRLPDGSESELDLLIGVGSGRTIWIECKTGKWQDFSERYKKTGNALGIEAQNAALVLLKSPAASACKTASSLMDMSVMGIQDFRAWFEGCFTGLQLDIPDEGSLAAESSLGSVLEECHPHPGRY